MFTMKNALYLNSKLDHAEEKISKLEYTTIQLKK